MFRNYFKIAYRNLVKNRVFSMVNIFGLAIGMAACFFIFVYVNFESGYDSFNKNTANLYRVPITFTGSLANNGKEATNHPAVGPAMKAEFPEVTNFTRVAPLSLFIPSAVISYTSNSSGNIVFNEEHVYVTDSSFLTMFSYPLLQGNAKDALSEANSIVLSETVAKKYFGNENAMGKTLHLIQTIPLKVTGVFADVPGNSHIKFDILISIKSLPFAKELDANWTWPEFYTYVLLAPGTNPQKIEQKFPAFIKRHLGILMAQLNYGADFHLQKVADIHLKSTYQKEPEASGSEKEIYLLAVIGAFLIFIAWINYINLTTAKSMERAKEIGLRKVVGAVKSQLFGQFIMESAIINLFALFLAAIIVILLFPAFNELTGKNLSPGLLSGGLLAKPAFWLSLAGIFILSVLLVSFYPALVLSAFNPAVVLKGKFAQTRKGILLRKLLVSFQFVLSILLIATTLIVYKQLSFMRNQQLGYNIDQLLVIKAPAIYDSAFNAKINNFRTALLKNPSVTSMTLSSDIPGQAIAGRNTIRNQEQDETHNFTPFELRIDPHFIETFQMGMAAGRNFRQEDSSGFSQGINMKVLINEDVAKALGYKTNEAAVNQHVVFRLGTDNYNSEIIGVVKNYHQRSLKEGFDPILYYYPSFNYWKYFSVRVNANNLSQNMASVEKLYKNVFTGNPFEYFFLNDYFNQQYQADQQFGKIFGLFTFLAIVIACLGLLGLSSFIIRLRTKEMGIRKVLGCSVYGIVMLLSKDFAKLVAIAAVITCPLIYIIADEWFKNYAFHTKLTWIIFAIPPLLLLVISLLTISVQSIKAALSNPIKSLKTE